MDIESLKEIFKNYVKNYDMNELAIIRKYYHSYRVMDLCIYIANKNNFSEKDTQISTLVGLLHDYARFEQWTKYKTYSDLNSIDHGDLAVKKLFDNNEIKDYCLNKEYYDEIYDAIKYHNKINFSDEISVHNKLICKVIRDADKLDIFYLLGAEKDLMKQDNKNISEKIKEDFYNHKQISRKEIQTENDNILLDLSMVYDLNFKCSFEYLKENNLINKMFENIVDKDRFKEYFDYINKYIEERIR
ncbi:MAG: HD domain-containing protein [Bacilli bacterium]|nr:HD domain-containing protein [Bacilli bacterium]